LGEIIKRLHTQPEKKKRMQKSVRKERNGPEGKEMDGGGSLKGM